MVIKFAVCKISLILFLSLIVCHCGYITGVDDSLTISRKVYTGNDLRVDGYYYRYLGEGTNRQISIYFLFRNGILLWAGPFADSTIATVEEQFRSGFYYNAVKEDKASWGVFEVDGSNIIYEKWGISIVKAKPA